MKYSNGRSRFGLVIGVAIVAVIAVVVASKYYDLGINRFFAAEPTVSSPPTPYPPHNNARNVYVLVPRTMYAGERHEAFVTFKNTGTLPWNNTGSPGNYANAYRIKSWGPADNNIWGVSFVPLPYTPVNMGQSATFTFMVTAPSTPGTYNFQWRMNQGGVGWFGQENPPISITVKPPLPTTSPTPTP